MDFRPKSRQQKLLDVMFPYFAAMDTEFTDEEFPLRVCRHLLALKTRAIDNHYVLSFIDIWNSEHPEEEELTNSELIWGLLKFDEVMTHRLNERHKAWIASNSTRAKLRVINGGQHRIS